MKTNLFTTVSRITLLVGSLLFFNPIFSQKPYGEELDAIFQTFITKDFKLLEPITKNNKSDRFARSNNFNKDLIAQQICLVTAPESYIVVKSETIGRNEMVTVAYQYADKIRTHYFTFDPKGRLISIQVRPASAIKRDI